MIVTDNNKTLAAALERIAHLEDALAHIERTAKHSRTGTRRLEWIAQRVQWALQGRPYDREAFTLPSAAPESYSKLRLSHKLLRKAFDQLGQENVILRHQQAGNAALLAEQNTRLRDLEWVRNLRL
ncbi:MAG: hypothetical protein CMJ75_19270 [Planctomycetaceae bacterium]|nr:hypothetical protein [Planctomycetaceae bacterium]